MRRRIKIAPADYKTVALKILNAGADIDITDNEGKTALMYFLQNKNMDLACALVDAGADVNMTDKKGKTALIYWSQGYYDSFPDDDDDDDYHEMRRRRIEIAPADYKTVGFKILNAGADINITDNEGKTALMYFLQNKNMDLACALIDAGADVNMTDKKGRNALICWARGMKEYDRYFFDGDDVYVEDEIVAMKKTNATDYKTVAFKMLNAGADINMADNEGKTALMYFLQNKNLDLACALIKAGADVNVTDNEGRTALIYFAGNQIESRELSRTVIFRYHGDNHGEDDDCERVASMIIKAATDINVIDKEGKTALIYSLQAKIGSLTRKLIDAGADVNVVDKDGKTALFYAAINSYECAGRYNLFRHHSNCDDIITSLMDTVHLDRENIIKLIEADADVNAKDHEGKTALMYYAENEYIDVTVNVFTMLEHEGKLQDELSKSVKHVVDDYNVVASALIQASSNVNTVDSQGKTALTYFLKSNKDYCASTLIKAGGNASIIDRDGKTALFYAGKSFQKVFLDNLIGTVTDINITDNERRTALMFAAQNNESLAFALIEAGADVKAVDKDGRNALFFASEKGNENIVSKLIKIIDINHTDNQGKTALLHAVQHSQTRVVAKLIEAGADVNVTDQQGRTALIYYALDDIATRVLKLYQMPSFHVDDPAKIDLNCVSSMLVKAGANLDMTDNEGKTALMYSLQNGRKDLACELIKAGADVNVTDKVGRSALIYCALEGRKERRKRTITQHYIFGLDEYPDDNPAIETKSVASLLINAGANLDIADYDGKTALMYSLQSNNENLACELIDAGADVKVTDGDGKTALMHCAQVGMPSTRERSSHSYLSMRYFYGEYPENMETSDSKRVASALIKAGVDINITDDEGKTALIYSLLSNRESLACTLIEAGADVKTTDKNGKTALFYALFGSNERRLAMSICESDEESSLTDTVQDNRESVISKLVEAGADVNITYDEGKTVLMYSIEKRNITLACLLIEAGAGVNVIDNEGKTALIHCSQEDNQNRVHVRLNYKQNNDKNKEMRSIACALIKAGADVNITDNQGKTALIYCVENGNENMVSILIEAGADVNIADDDGGTALVHGAGNESIVRKLIVNGKAQVNKRDRHGRLPLFYAITESLPSARHLLERSVLRRKDNKSILLVFVEHCLRRKRNCSFMSEGFNLLHDKGVQREAISEALINSVFCRILLTTLELQDSKSSGPLSQKTDVKKIFQALNLAKEYIAEDAYQKCQSIQNMIMMIKEATDLCTIVPNILNSLLELGANPCYADIDGNTALHYAVCLPFAGVPQDIVMKICDELDESGASVNAKNHQNENPLLFCLSKVGWVERSNKSSKVKFLVEVCRFLLEQGSSVEETARNGKSVFHLIIELFLQGFRVRDDTIRKSVLNDSLTLLELFPSSLVTNEGIVNKRDDGSLNTPLHLWAMLQFSLPLKKEDAVDHNAFEKQILASVFKHLLACGAKLNDRNGIEQTPLHLCKTWTAAKLLIDAGAKTDVVDYVGSSPLVAALERNRIESDANCIYPDGIQPPKEFWKTVVEKKLDPWAVNSHGKSVMSILVRSKAFVLAKTLTEVACEGNFIQSDATAVSLLNAICKDRSTRAQWKSILVEEILKSRIITPKDREDTPLHFCCRNIVREIEMVFPPRQRHLGHLEDSFMNDMMTSVHWTIVKQLLSYGFSSKLHDSSDRSCIDIAKECPALKDLLTKPLSINEVPLVIPWNSISKTHKNALEKVARRQECRQIDSFWYHENNIQEGSFGLVFVGINEKDGREVAVKRIEKLRMHRPEDKREITNLTKLADCEQVVRYLIFPEDKDFSYVVLELMEGNLKDYLEGKDYDAKKGIKLCDDVVKGLKYLHNKKFFIVTSSQVTSSIKPFPSYV